MHVFVTGAGGYIGGAVASRLVQAGHTVTGLIRDVAKTADLARLGIQPVVGTLDDTVRAARARDLLGWRPQHHSITNWITNTDFTGTVRR